MNFNKNPTLSPKKNHNNIMIIIGVIGGIIAAVLILTDLMNAQNNMEHLSNPSLSVDQVTNMCIEKLRDILDTEPPKLSVNVCVGTVLGELNK